MIQLNFNVRDTNLFYPYLLLWCESDMLCAATCKRRRLFLSIMLHNDSIMPSNLLEKKTLSIRWIYCFLYIFHSKLTTIVFAFKMCFKTSKIWNPPFLISLSSFLRRKTKQTSAVNWKLSFKLLILD